jgi:hypothetical protein
LRFCKKKVPAVAGAFFVVLRAFFEGVLEKRVFFGGIFAVNWWWIRGELWWF